MYIDIHISINMLSIREHVDMHRLAIYIYIYIHA